MAKLQVYIYQSLDILQVSTDHNYLLECFPSKACCKSEVPGRIKCVMATGAA